MSAISRAWNRFWFSPQSATDLAVCRILFFGGLLHQRWRHDSAQWTELRDAFWFPIRVFQKLNLPLLDAPILGVLDTIWLVALAACCVGVLTRVSTAVAFVVGAYLIAIPHNFGKIHHSDAVIVILLGALVLSRCGDKWSVDAWIRNRGRSVEPQPSGEYRWPIRVAWLMWVLIYCAAGISKIRNSGLDWVFSDSFRNLLLAHHYTHQPLVSLGMLLAEYSWLCTALAGWTILIETLAPVALFSATARAIIIPTIGLMQVSIWFLLGVRFDSYALVFLFWIPWERIGRWLSSWLEVRRSPAPISTSG
jgi:hypothetical protein